MGFLKGTSATVSRMLVTCTRTISAVPGKEPVIQPTTALVTGTANQPMTNDTASDEKSTSADTSSNTDQDSYIEHDITVSEWIHSLLPSKNGVLNYFRSLFPCIDWIPRYNWRWLLGDAIAGMTVGLVVVPQAMAYALLADLTPEFGLYTSFTGAAIYWLFGTSKDIVIGTTAVGSLLVGSVISKVQDAHPDTYSNPDVARTLSFVIGAIMLPVGFLRLGWIIDIIPYIPISAFVTSASITVMSTQFPVMMGITGINTREPPYRVIIETLKGLPRTQLDAAVGISSLILLTVIRDVCAKLEVRQPARKRFWAMVSSLRLTFAMLLYTLIAWLVHRTLPKDERKFRLVGHIDSGFQYVGVPRLDGELITSVLPHAPVIIIILIIEHIAIAKSFGKQFNYMVIPSQEIMAQSSANLLGPFVGGYACTGSFGASAVLSKAAVRTPLAGLFSALLLLLALYALTAVFYYIPHAALAGLIIHAVMNLLASLQTLRKYWRLSPLELLIWVVGVVAAVFSHLETSIYITIGLSIGLLLVRVARTRGSLLGEVTIWQPVAADATDTSDSQPGMPTHPKSLGKGHRETFISLDRNDASNPAVFVKSPYPGVFVYRFAEGFNFLNQAQQLGNLARYIRSHSRVGKTESQVKASDRLWSDASGSKSLESIQKDLPVLRAVVFDCSSINNIDVTSVEGLVDLRNSLERHARPSTVDWHFATLTNRWARRALVAAGFGLSTKASHGNVGKLAPVYCVASSLAGASSEDAMAEETRRRRILNLDDESRVEDKDLGIKQDSNSRRKSQRMEGHTGASGGSGGQCLSFQPVHGVNRPFFHIDLTQAVVAAVQEAKEADRHLCAVGNSTDDSEAVGGSSS
ncbi:uncharacterized protein A1O9_11082 [Exophiala aquamarina CBS 119918]|uniref:STAS domain-containing protein n=1 Tax=Exophiala aquamarina CBS 119918 TaxID=1182545 RepID=A0A072PAQ8_9EURO|nr:uncharacterized protein A1O9_11082 [Exophiala aquamarina CBS 119918]KEF52665.1 hypothetical protein A1O9_11082 [Exophiala aquamarina CBS 119918]